MRVTAAGRRVRSLVGRRDGAAELCPGTNDGSLGTWMAGYTVAPDVAVIHLGTEDVIGGEPNDVTVDEIRDVVAGLQDNNPGMEIIVAQVIPVAGPKDSEITDLNGRLADEFPQGPAEDGHDPRIHLVDLNTGFDRAWLDNENHPDHDGQVFMATRIFEAVRDFTEGGAPPGNR